MTKKFKAVLADKTTHVSMLEIDLDSDGYMTALADAHEECKKHPQLYVSKVTKE